MKRHGYEVITNKGNLVATWTVRTEFTKIDQWIEVLNKTDLEQLIDTLWETPPEHRKSLSSRIERLKSTAEKSVFGKILT